MQSAIALLMVGTAIATIGATAIIVHIFRRRAPERFLLWFGLFSILYGTILVVRNSVFRLAFGQPQASREPSNIIAGLNATLYDEAGQQ